MWRAGARTVDANTVGMVRHRFVAGRHLLTNDTGDWIALDDAELRRFLEGRLRPGGAADDPLYARLLAGRLLHGELELSEVTRTLRRRYAPLLSGPSRHVLTLRGADGEVMNPETARRCVVLALDSTCPVPVLELAGEDPLDAWETLTEAVTHARRLAHVSQRRLRVVLRSRLERLNEDHHAWLVAEDVRIRAIMTPEAIADRRSTPRWWLTRFNKAWREAGLDLDVVGSDLIVRHLEPDARDIVRAARAMKSRLVSLERPPALPLLRGDDGDASGGRDTPSLDEWLEQYSNVLSELVLVSGRGQVIAERTAAGLLRRILSDDGGDFPVGSPPRVGMGELAYDPSGGVWATETGMAVGALGDDLFLLGQAGETPYHDVVTHPTARALAMAMSLHGQPGCTGCAYLPYCGAAPAAAYGEHGSLHGRVLESEHHIVQQTALDLLFKALLTPVRGETDSRAVFRAWAGLGKLDESAG